jgi:hypothetical protein
MSTITHDDDADEGQLRTVSIFSALVALMLRRTISDYATPLYS